MILICLIFSSILTRPWGQNVSSIHGVPWMLAQGKEKEKRLPSFLFPSSRNGPQKRPPHVEMRQWRCKWRELVGAGRRGRELWAPGAPPPSSSLLSQPVATARAWPQMPPSFTKNARTLQPLESDVSGQWMKVNIWGNKGRQHAGSLSQCDKWQRNRWAFSVPFQACWKLTAPSSNSRHFTSFPASEHTYPYRKYVLNCLQRRWASSRFPQASGPASTNMGYGASRRGRVLEHRAGRDGRVWSHTQPAGRVSTPVRPKSGPTPRHT